MTEKLPTKKILIFDIETNSNNAEKAILRYFGAYSYLTGKRYYLKGDDNIQKIQEIIDNHDIIVGFNQKRFDCRVLEKYGVSFLYKTQVDLWEVLSDPRLDPKTRNRTGGKGRGAYMGLKLNSWSLGNIVKALELGEYKSEFDYTILERPPEEWTQDEHQLIVEYLGQDITITKRLFEYTNNFYYPFTEYLSDKNIRKLAYITSSVASLAYKIICHQAGVEEEYGEGPKEFDYEGGYVRYPTREQYVGEILCFDFNSLYPSIFRGFNLFSPIDNTTPPEHTFSGNTVFKIKGKYKTDKLGVIESAVADLYAQRKAYKKAGDRREYLIKIIINSLYGITPKPTFAQVYNRYGAEDCTYIGRIMIKYVAEEFDRKGFEVLYGDTDSVYVALKGKTKEEALALAKNLSEYFKTLMPFPHDDFGLGLDEEIKAMFFFKGDDHYKKKNYIYITKDNKLKIKGLMIIKSNASRIATHILRKYLKEQIVENCDIKFYEGYLKQLIYHELEQDLGLATQTYKVKSFEEYASETSLYAQIAKQYKETEGSVVSLVPNNKFGIGKGKKYCTIEEFKKEHLSVRDVDLSSTMSCLEPFIKSEQQNLNDF